MSRQQIEQLKSVKHSKVLHILLFAGILMSLSLYIFSVNGVTSDRFALDEMKQKASDLNQKNYELSLEASEAKSIMAIEKKAVNLNLEEVKKISYIKGNTGSALVLGN